MRGFSAADFKRWLVPAVMVCTVSCLGSSHLTVLLSAQSTAAQVDEQAFVKLIKEEGTEAARRLFEETRKRNPDAVLFSEPALNKLGYEILRQHGKVKEAIEIFRLNVEAYPSSSNVYDSLAEAYMNDGQETLAIQNYRRSIELNPRNGNAAHMLARIQIRFPKSWVDRSPHKSAFVTINRGLTLHHRSHSAAAS